MKTKIGIVAGFILAGVLYYSLGHPFRTKNLSTTEVHEGLGLYGLHDVGFELDKSDRVLHAARLGGISTANVYQLQFSPERLKNVHSTLIAASNSAGGKDASKTVRLVAATDMCANYPIHRGPEIPSWWNICEKTPVEFENWSIEYHRSDQRNDFRLAMSISKTGTAFIFLSQNYPQGYPSASRD